MPCVLHLTDLHLFADPSGIVKDVCTRNEVARVFAFIREGISAGRWDFDQIIITGDLAHDELRDTYDVLREMLGDWLPRCKLLLGNHDSRPFIRDAFPELANDNPEHFTFSQRLGTWQLIGLDSHVSGEVAGCLGNKQLTWLDEELDKHSERPTLLFVHHPPFNVGSAWVDEIGLTDAAQLIAIVSQHSQVRAICAGHVHQELADQLGEIRLMTTPSAVVQFSRGSAEFRLDPIPPGFRILNLDGDDFSSEVIRLPT